MARVLDQLPRRRPRPSPCCPAGVPMAASTQRPESPTSLRHHRGPKRRVWPKGAAWMCC